MSKRKPNNAWLAKKQAEKAAEQTLRTQVNVQFALDAAVIAANNVFHRKGDKIIEFIDEFNKQFRAIAVMMIKDSADDEEIWYTKDKVDGLLKDIVGEEHFQPWEVRYDFF
jgi:hypothetical protein